MSPDSGADEALVSNLLDEVLPDELEWKRLVRRYPRTALLVAAAGGFYLGRSRGLEILRALADFAADTVTEGVNEAVGREVL